MSQQFSPVKLFMYIFLIVSIGMPTACKKHSPGEAVLQITSFAPASAAKDSLVVIQGSGFVSGGLVTVNGIPATVVAASPTSITVKVPARAGSGVISVVMNGKHVNSADELTYLYTVRTLAGNGNFGYKEGAGAEAEFNPPNSVAADDLGNVYVADIFNNRVRKINSAGEVSTLAGDGTKTFKEGQGNAAAFYYPYGVAVAGNTGVVYVADGNNNRIRKISFAGAVSTLAGDGTAGYRDGAGPDARFMSEEAVAVDVFGNVYVADTYNNRIRKISPAGVVSTLAGDGNYGYKNGAGGEAQFKYPTGVAVDRAGNVYVADVDNNRIRKISPAGEVSTLAGDGTAGFNDGPGVGARFNNPTGIAADSLGNVYVAESLGNRIRKISPAGEVSTLAGDGTEGFKEGVGVKARFDYPCGIAVDVYGNIYVADAGNYRVRKME